MKQLSESLLIQDAFEAVKYGKGDILAIMASFAFAMGGGYVADKVEPDNHPAVSSTPTFLNPTNKPVAEPIESTESIGEVLNSTFTNGRQVVTLSVGDATSTIVYACAPHGGLTRSRSTLSTPAPDLLIADDRVVTNRYYCADNVLTNEDGFLPSGSKIAFPHP